jgi:hypothetical protein
VGREGRHADGGGRRAAGEHLATASAEGGVDGRTIMAPLAREPFAGSALLAVFRRSGRQAARRRAVEGDVRVRVLLRVRDVRQAVARQPDVGLRRRAEDQHRRFRRGVRRDVPRMAGRTSPRPGPGAGGATPSCVAPRWRSSRGSPSRGRSRASTIR